MPAKTYRFRYSADNKDLEVEGDRAFVLAMIKRFGPEGGSVTPAGKVTKTTKNLPLPDQPVPKDVSLREFIQQLSLKKHTDIVLAFGFYLEKYRGMQDFAAADINNCYYESKLEASNSSQMIINNIRSGRMMEAKTKSEKGRLRFMLTDSGEKFIKEKATPAS